VKLQRASGVLLHLTSLPGRYGIGDLGESARDFADRMADAKQSVWCILPFGPPGPFNSPYQSCSAFAGSPLLLSPDELVAAGYLSKRDLSGAPRFPAGRVDYTAVTKFKTTLLRRAFQAFSETREYSAFLEKESWWLRPYLDFMSLLHANRGKPWNKFDQRAKPSPKVAQFHVFLQFEFFRQWSKFRTHCKTRDVRILGDLPFYVEFNSADVWSNPTLFDLDAKNEMRTVGGVPPDYFSRDGQRWGSPTYRWDRIAEQGYRWWIDRFRFSFEHMDLLRVDHFRGFEAYWASPAKDKTARNGRWIPGPGAALFRAVQQELGNAAIVAENLGVISPEVEALRNQFGFPGLAVLQFGFGADAVHYPENYTPHTVAFTGTHDNDTINGWWRDLQARAANHRDAGARETFARAKILFGTRGSKVHWPAIETVLNSNAGLAVFPLQDVLGLRGAARMNLPGKQRGNWTWRVQAKQLKTSEFQRLRELTESSGRATAAN
jgi:4-alpha-glucanotransferase